MACEQYRRKDGGSSLPLSPYICAMKQSRIRNFCIVAHIDHGKSTLADRLIEITGTVAKRDMQEQLLDTMDLERERGITIKLNAVRMTYTARDGVEYELNLIDTPGHVDFTYEVSRSLAACEGRHPGRRCLAGDPGPDAVESLPGPRRRPGDHPGAQQDRPPRRRAGTARQGDHGPGRRRGRRSWPCRPRMAPGFRSCSRRSSPGSRRRAAPRAPLRALIFDSYYDRYRGVIPSIRVVDGELRPGMQIAFGAHPDEVYDVAEVGVLALGQRRTEGLTAGEVGYFIANLRDVRDARVGDTVFDAAHRATELLPGYREVKSMVFAGRLPHRRRPVRRPARRAGEAPAQRRLAAVRAGIVHRARLRLPLRLPRPAAHGDRPGATAARVLPLADHHRAHRRVSRLHHRRQDAAGREPQRAPRSGQHRPHRGAVREGADHGAGRLHRRHHEPGPGAPRRIPRHDLPRRRAGRVHLRLSARRDRARLLRQAEVDLARLRVARLRTVRIPRVAAGAARHADQRRPDRRLQRDHPPRQGVRVGPEDRREAQGAHSPAALRRRDPGGHRQQGHRARSRSRRCARTCSPSAMAATSPASGSSSRSRRRARSG